MYLGCDPVQRVDIFHCVLLPLIASYLSLTPILTALNKASLNLTKPHSSQLNTTLLCPASLCSHISVHCSEPDLTVLYRTVTARYGSGTGKS